MATTTLPTCLFKLQSIDPNGNVQFSPGLFLGPDGQLPTIEYSNNFDASEQLAKRFQNESIVGFDMEWIFRDGEQPTDPRTLQERVSLIQVASQDRIALFHIGRHQGETPKDLIPPALASLIENPSIRKAGQSIMGDFSRLKRYFDLIPKGAFELSYFHQLVAQEKTYITKYVYKGLAGLVQMHFPGMTMMKDSAFHKDWLKPLTQEHRAYATADVYASLMLFYPMNEKRLQMAPCPPLPLNAEEYMEYRTDQPINRVIRLEPLQSGTRSLNANEFFFLHEGLEESSVNVSLSSKEQQLYERLTAWRDMEAKNVGLSPKHIATDSVLRCISLSRPKSIQDCSKLEGLNLLKHKKLFAKEWVRIVNESDSESVDESATKCEESRDQKPAVEKEAADGAENMMPKTPAVSQDIHPTTPVLIDEPKVESVPQHTGLSFSLAEADLSDGDTEYGSDFSLEDMKNMPEKQETACTGTNKAQDPPEASLSHTGISFSMEDTTLDNSDKDVGEKSRARCEGERSPRKRRRSSSSSSNVETGRKSPVKKG